MPLFARPKFRRGSDGTYAVSLEPYERELLRSLPGQLRDLLSTDDPSLVRLYPPAYVSDDEANDEYRRLTRGDLTSRRLEALDLLESTVDSERLTEEQLAGWMGVLNDLRLVLGTRLDVSEDDAGLEVPDDDPDAPAWALYGYLGWLLEAVVEARSSAL
jgi:hypothetical protein